ncbi:hypothetical protein ABZ816_31690 [Actinosynnema sp. NPDC047251]|uniref:Abortive infection protein n=1 Tax=Saccharothrix espanaensis (strain ATCC 51144 / DSM 44229 / JCM 9112 / NBRC 15066 / NRRL 15764) TaxID=1179773 RepID=K0JXK5_SACES|nr:hypothetical protein [Saccharothrix espanaensis]CCH30057.1 hypothetical protein BN6_27450 [Saccharothrix espanaensis DSM 44229]
MRAKGIGYDTGFINQSGVSTHEEWDPAEVARDLRRIRDDLRCTAVRLTGGDPDRLETAARIAAELGLEVWFSPFTNELTTDELLAVLADCADRAERVRRAGASVVLVTGAELSLFTKGFLPGEDGLQRTDALLHGPRDQVAALLADVPRRINEFLARAVRVVRERFGGPVTYASIPFEGVDWTPFDIVSVDAYRAAEIADRYEDLIRGIVAQGKPVAITEFGAATYRGAADLGARGTLVVEYTDGRPSGFTRELVRDEQGQAGYLRDLVGVFERTGVDAAFGCTYASFHLPHGGDPDLDLASFGVVRVDQDGTRVPKESFSALADAYRQGVISLRP